MLIFLVLITIRIASISSQTACDFNLELVTNLLPETCYSRTDANYYYIIENCLPHCKEFTRKTPGTCNAKKSCVPGYQCVSNRCKPDNTTCSLYYVPFSSNNYYKTVFRPTCDTDGSFAPKQCKGEYTTGRCFCYNSAGERIFGQEWWSQATNMTCACSRKKTELRAEGKKYYVSLHCDSKGNYEALQCDSETNLCWCADNQTGNLTSMVVPESAMIQLPCYNITETGEQYLRQCESQQFAQAKIKNKFYLHGTTTVNFATLLCDDDGTYGSYKISDSNVYCTWKNNTNIGTWQGTTSELSTIDCNCARDSIIFANAGQTLTQQCTSYGNYDPYQSQGTTAYCVDSDGYQNSHDDNPPTSESDCQNLI